MLHTNAQSRPDRDILAPRRREGASAEVAMLKRAMGWIVLGLVVFLGGVAEAQSVPGATGEDRGVNGARAYLKKIGASRLEQTMMLVSLFAKAQPKYLDEWERLTSIRIRTVEYGYTEIPAKIMAEAVAKTGEDDIFNHQMYMLPDAAEA